MPSSIASSCRIWLQKKKSKKSVKLNNTKALRRIINYSVNVKSCLAISDYFMSYLNVIDNCPANSPHQEPIPSDVCEVTGTVESIEHSGVSKHDTPFVKLIFRAVTGELYRFTKFDATQEQVEQFIGQSVQALFECSVDARGNRHKNIVGQFRVLQGASGHQNTAA